MGRKVAEVAEVAEVAGATVLAEVAVGEKKTRPSRKGWGVQVLLRGAGDGLLSRALASGVPSAL
jgi:hypothetical protein